MPQNLEQKIEALLFYKNEPQDIKTLCNILEVGESEIRESLKSLSESLGNRGICLVLTENEAALATSPEMKDFIEMVAKEEMKRDIGKAGLETLAIILYNGEVSRREIDYIRGVNSAFILRNLCMRGLVDKVPNTKDQRTFKYKGSISLLAHLGLKSFQELPEFEAFKAKINELKDQSENNDDQN